MALTAFNDDTSQLQPILAVTYSQLVELKFIHRDPLQVLCQKTLIVCRNEVTDKDPDTRLRRRQSISDDQREFSCNHLVVTPATAAAAFQY